MNLPVFLRRVFIVFFSLCLILNVGYNFFNWIKTANFSKNKNELGTIKIYSSDKRELTKIQNTYFEGNKETKLKLEDIYGKPIYYLKSNIGKKHFKYAKKYFADNKYNISLISSSENSNEIKIEKEFVSQQEAEDFAEQIKDDIGINSEIISKTDIHKKVYCLYSNNINFGYAEKIAKENSKLEIKWTKSTKKD